MTGHSSSYPGSVDAVSREALAKAIWAKRPDGGQMKKPWPGDGLTPKERRGLDHDPPAAMDLCFIYVDAVLAALVAQRIEQGSSKSEVAGSIPAERAKSYSAGALAKFLYEHSDLSPNQSTEVAATVLSEYDVRPHDHTIHALAQRQPDRTALAAFIKAYGAQESSTKGLDDAYALAKAALAAQPSPAADEDHPDCVTDRECELYDALMGLASAVTGRQGWSKWVHGGVQIAPIVHKALRLHTSSVPSTHGGSASK